MAANQSPELVTRLVEIVNRGDTDGFLAMFVADGEVDDWGRRFASPATIRAWSDSEFIGKKVRLAVTSIDKTPTQVDFLAEVTSESVNGPTRFTVIGKGSQIREMRLRPTNGMYAWLLDVRRMFASPRR